MRLNTLAIVVVAGVAVVAVMALPSHSKFCKYWCKAEHHHGEHVYYCCPSGKSESWLPESMWPIMSSPIFWIGMLGTTIGAHAHSAHHDHNDDHESTLKIITEKHCPPVRPSCPRSFDWYEAPNWCQHDEECGHREKCCFDICLEHNICKPAE